ncbi:MAG: 16S rRNA (guanine(527)-N(7))-methyltransferase RsmG [Elusimicrobiota bacterium]
MKESAEKAMSDALKDWGIGLDASRWRLLEGYARDVLEHNRKTNLTAAKDRETVLLRHILDGCAAVLALRGRLGAGARVADLGAGAGFIGIGLKLAWPELDVTLLDSNYKKTCFLNLACARLGLPGLHALQASAGEWRGGAFDAVVSRAVAPLDEAAGLTLPLVRPGGWAVLYQSQEACGPAVEQTVRYRLPGEDKDRCLIILRRT